MKTSEFNYDLPQHFIAQTPAEPRDSSRLLVLDRATGSTRHHLFREIGQFLHAGDLLVLNRTRVIPARIYARKATGGQIELLLLRRAEPLTWHALVGGAGMRERTALTVENGPSGEVVSVLHGAERLIRFAEPIEPYFPVVGHVPLPPYIHETLQDAERYQTVYAREPGSAAAPTAGLHFTERLLNSLQSAGVQSAFVTLHVGLDTFAPVTEDDASHHEVHKEWCEVSQEVVDQIRLTKKRGGRVVAVGTTAVRTLESAARDGEISAYSGDTDLFILPGYKFRVVDAMVTNFHLPRSTLLMLVSAFAGRNQMLATYELAKREGYRFYSFGDAMLLI